MSAPNISDGPQSDKRSRDAIVTQDPRRPMPVETPSVVAPDSSKAKKEKKDKHHHEEDDAEKREKKDKKKEKKEKKRREAEADGTLDADDPTTAAAAAASAEVDSDDGDKSKKDRKREKKERKEKERLERETEQAEKDAAVIAAASSAAQALNAVASAPRLPLLNIDPLLAGDAAPAEATTLPEEDVPMEPVTETPPPDASEDGAFKKGKGKRGRPAKSASTNGADDDADEDYADASSKKKPRGGRAKTDKADNFESLRNLAPRELLVDRVYSSDTLKKLEREIGLKYKKGRFTAQEEEILKNGIEEFKQRKNFSDDDFQELLYNYKTKGWERDFTELWKDLTGRLEDRANISVRLHIKTRHSQYRNKGKYTLAEDHEIRYRLGELKDDIGKVAKRLGRLGQDISSRWVKLQVRDEMINGPAFTAEEDEAVMEALEKHKRDHPDELVSWKEIAKELGNKRSYKVYSACTHSIASRVRKRKAQKDSQDPSHSQSLQRGNRSTKRDLAQGDGWIPGDDDLCLLQRLEYQQVMNEAQIKWEQVNFDDWQWPIETLMAKYEEIKTKNLPVHWAGNLANTLDKLIKIYRAKEVKKRKAEDDEADDVRNIDQTMLPDEHKAGLGSQPPPPALDPALRAGGVEALAAAAAAAVAQNNGTVPLDQQQVDDMLS